MPTAPSANIPVFDLAPAFPVAGVSRVTAESALGTVLALFTLETPLACFCSHRSSLTRSPMD